MPTRIWIHNKRAGLIDEEGREGYVCRGFRKEDDPLLSAAPDLYEALKAIEDTYTRCPCCLNLRENGHDYTCKLAKALAKAEGK